MRLWDANETKIVQAYLMAVSAMSVADATAAFDAGTFDASKALDIGTIAVNAAKGAYVSQTVVSSLESSQTFYAILVNGDQYAITHTVAATMKTIGDTVVAFKELSLEDGTFTMAWNKMGTDVPEPTSGLLMLVGLAGLALRRKRA